MLHTNHVASHRTPWHWLQGMNWALSPSLSFLPFFPWPGMLMKALVPLFHLVPHFPLLMWKRIKGGGLDWRRRDKASLFLAESEDSQMKSFLCNLIAALITGTAATPTDGQRRASISHNFADTK